MNRFLHFTVSPADSGQRLDRYLTAQLPDLSRTRLQELIDEGCVRVSGRTCKPSRRVEAGESVEVKVLPRPSLDAAPEAIPLDILYEDDDVVVVNKPAGMTVHAGAGKHSARGTLVNALMHRFGQLSAEGGPLRPGIVHRLDRTTSGAIVVARNDAAHRNLADQFRSRTVKKTYLALVHRLVKKDTGSIALPIARDVRRRTRMTTRQAQAGRAAQTNWRALLRIGNFTLVEADLLTGRTHQIRVHFSALGHPVVGDALYGAPKEPRIGSLRLPLPGRNFLHAARICFLHPQTGKPVEARAPLPAELKDYLARLAAAAGVDWSDIDAAAGDYL